MVKYKKPKMLKKVSSVPSKLPKKGKVSVRPVSFHMDKFTDKYVVTGGGYDPVVIGGDKRHALRIANARIRVIAKRKVARGKKR